MDCKIKKVEKNKKIKWVKWNKQTRDKLFLNYFFHLKK